MSPSWVHTSARVDDLPPPLAPACMDCGWHCRGCLHTTAIGKPAAQVSLRSAWLRSIACWAWPCMACAIVSQWPQHMQQAQTAQENRLQHTHGRRLSHAPRAAARHQKPLLEVCGNSAERRVRHDDRQHHLSQHASLAAP
jgi:hypothetical protein